MNKNTKVFALKYRPQLFDDLIGQDVVAETITELPEFYDVSELEQEKMRSSVSHSIIPRYTFAYTILLIIIFGIGASVGVILGVSHWFDLEGKKLEF